MYKRQQLLSGVVNGHTTGTAIALMIENQNARSGDYAKTADLDVYKRQEGPAAYRG